MLTISLVSCGLIFACASDLRQSKQENQPQLLFSSTSELQRFACERIKDNDEPWGVNNLYNCNTGLLYIPYQLWTGVAWNGDKTARCMHPTFSSFSVNGDSKTTITGPRQWINPKSDEVEQVWVRDKVSGSKTQYFTCHKKGIGRVYDSRRSRFYTTGRCKFPAGEGWELSKRRYCETTSIQITQLAFDYDGNLLHMKFKWWSGETLDHVYRYVPNYGMAYAWKQ